MKAFYGKQKVMNKAGISQSIVKQWLEELGCIVAEVSHPNANGVDITAIKNGKSFTFEVKTAIYTARQWRVNKTNTSGKKCDYIAIVLPDNHVLFDSMKNHLILCSKNGNRNLTDIVNLHKWMAKRV